jgi:hypothetical protein
MAGALEGLKILLPESRQLDLFTALLEDEGAVALRGIGHPDRPVQGRSAGLSGWSPGFQYATYRQG